MSTGEGGVRKLAVWLVKHAARVSPADRREWFEAMINELEHIPRGASALRWALGCAVVSYVGRMQIMTRSFTSLPRWLVCVEMAVCLVPLTLLFVAVLGSTARGVMRLEDGMLYGSATVLGPVGLAVALRVLFASGGGVGRATTTLLGLLAAWTVLAYSGQVLHSGVAFTGWWREFVLIALLPMVAVVHLLQINSHRRGGLAIA